MNNEIESIFKNFKMDDITIPIEWLNYRGKDGIYLTYQSIGDNPALASDDKTDYSIDTIDIDIYIKCQVPNVVDSEAKSKYLKVIKEVKKIMLENDFVWDGDSPDMYENDTGYLHKTTSFKKEREV